MTLPWYLKPMQPSRVPWLWHILPSLLIAAFFVATAVYARDVLPVALPGPLVLIIAVVGWGRLVQGLVRRRKTGACPGFSIPGVALAAASMTLLGLPTLLWPRSAHVDPLPPHASTVSLVCWCLAGVLMGTATYFMLSHTHRPHQEQHA